VTTGLCPAKRIGGRARLLLAVSLAALALVALTSMICSPARAIGPAVLYVDADATGAHDGASWTDAFTNVQEGLGIAMIGDQIWVAEGVYYPDEGVGETDNDPTSAFHLVSGVSLYGGFAATETLLSERDWQAHVTVLSGDMDQNDTVDGNGVVTDTDGISGTNAYHVVRAGTSITESAALDGVRITAGNAISDASVVNIEGAGMYSEGDPTLTNIMFIGNHALFDGGGMFNDEGDPTLTNVIFSGNEVPNTGGGMYNQRGNPTLNNVSFNGNLAGWGGGMRNYKTTAVLTDVTFDGNRAIPGSGGAMYSDDSLLSLTNVDFYNNHADQSGGAGYNYGGVVTLTNGVVSGNTTSGHGGGLRGGPFILTNVTLSGNRASYYGGAIYNSSPALTLTNVIVSGNRGSPYGAGIVNSSGGDFVLTNVTLTGNDSQVGAAVYNMSTSAELTLTNCIVWNNRSSISNGRITVRYSDVQGGYPGAGNIDADPRFIAPVNYSGAPTTAGDLRLQFGSPAIDAGDNTAVAVATDLDGYPRIVGGTVDMGAYEYVLGLRKTVSPDTDVAPHGVVTYTVLLDNPQMLDEAGALLTDTLPAEVDFGHWIEQPGGASQSDDQITWSGTLTAGTAITFAFTATHNGGCGDVVENTVTYSGTSVLDDSATFTVAAPDLVIHKSAAPSISGPRGPITYTLTFSNTGTFVASGVVITDEISLSVTDASVIQSSVEITQVGGTHFVWNVEDLEPGQDGVIVVAGVLRNLLPSGTFINTATIGTATHEVDLTDNGDSASVTVQAHYVFLPLVLRDWP
jgi:uncharacterized repeat protein (TIGR01451 family)